MSKLITLKLLKHKIKTGGIDSSNWICYHIFYNFPGGSDGKVSACKCGRPKFDPWIGTIPWRRKWQPTPVLLSGKSHGQRGPGRLQPMGSQRVGHD